MLVAFSPGLCKPCVLWPTTDDEEDLDVLDPAQLALAHASQHQPQQPQKHQLHQEQQQQPQLYVNCQECYSCRQHCTHQAPGGLQSDAVFKATQVPDWQLLDSNEPSGWSDEQQEEKLIRMNDPLFSSLSERRQKLMALEEILLNTGIEG